jgi:hypothetical protein
MVMMAGDTPEVGLANPHPVRFEQEGRDFEFLQSLLGSTRIELSYKLFSLSER